MIFSLAVYGAPYSQQCTQTAYQFAKAALENGHTIYRVFFYQDGAHNASNLATPPQNEHNIPEMWQALAATHHIDLVVCIGAALRRGVINSEEANRYEKPAANLLNGFNLSGLGQLVDAGVHSDRLVTFAP